MNRKVLVNLVQHASFESKRWLVHKKQTLISQYEAFGKQSKLNHMKLVSHAPVIN